tara:strand:- start:378 stop:845 length:468 start_codon:yes stop_codon:yes gene_type:complete
MMQQGRLQRQHAVMDVIAGAERGNQWQDLATKTIETFLPEGYMLTKPLAGDNHRNIHFNGKTVGLRIDHKEQGVYLSTYHLTKGHRDGKGGMTEDEASAFGLRVVTNTTGWDIGKKGFVGARVHKGGIKSRTINLTGMSRKKLCNLVSPFIPISA